MPGPDGAVSFESDDAELDVAKGGEGDEALQLAKHRLVRAEAETQRRLCHHEMQALVQAVQHFLAAEADWALPHASRARRR